MVLKNLTCSVAEHPFEFTKPSFLAVAPSQSEHSQSIHRRQEILKMTKELIILVKCLVENDRHALKVWS
jgi:hypothetical protein